MKKLIIAIGLGVMTSVTSFAQGYFVFADSGSTAVWDNFTTPGTAAKSPANVMVGIFWSADQNASIAALGSGSSTQGQVGSWSSITGAAGFSLAQSAGAVLTAPTRTGLSLGTFNGGAVGIDGTTAGQTIALYVVAWKLSDGAAGFGSSSVLGWSNKIVETLGSSSAPGLTLAGGITSPIYVNSVPEPATFALAGVGIAALLIARRRK